MNFSAAVKGKKDIVDKVEDKTNELPSKSVKKNSWKPKPSSSIKLVVKTKAKRHRQQQLTRKTAWKESSTHEKKHTRNYKRAEIDHLKLKDLRLKGVKQKPHLSVIKKAVLVERRTKLLLFKPFLNPCPYVFHPASSNILCHEYFDNKSTIYRIEKNSLKHHPASWSSSAEEIALISSSLRIKENFNKALPAGINIMNKRIDLVNAIPAYVNQALDVSFDQGIYILLRSLFLLQKKQVQKDPIKAKSKKMLVFGMKEVHKALKANLLVAVTVAINVEESLKLTTSLTAESKLKQILDLTLHAASKSSQFTTSDGLIRIKPELFLSLKRRKLGEAICKRSAVVCVGIKRYESEKKLFIALQKRVQLLRETYLTYVIKIEVCFLCEFVPDNVIFINLISLKILCPQCFQRSQREERKIKRNIESSVVINQLKDLNCYVQICRILDKKQVYQKDLKFCSDSTKVIRKKESLKRLHIASIH